MVTHAAHNPPLRLTRRGRVVVLVFFVVLASLASAVLFATASRAENPPAGLARTVVVRTHDALRSDFDLAGPVRTGRSGTSR
jgi:hypothetical protein